MKPIVLAVLAAPLLLAAAPAPGLLPPPENQKLAHDLFRDIIAVHSVHDVGTKGVADILAKSFLDNGFAPEDVKLVPEDKYPNQVNLVVRLHGKGKGKPVMWICHMDVVEAKAEDWTVPPFVLTEKDGYFYGRGTSDMKDQDAAVAASLIRLKKEGFVPDRDIIAAFTADEEVGLEQDGPAFLLRAHRDLVDAGLVINPDGSSGEIVAGKKLDFGIETSQKTYVTYTMTVTNRGGHSSEPRPDNAIYQLSDALVRLSKFQFPFKTNATTRLYFQRRAAFESGQRRADMLALSKGKVDAKAAARLAKDTALNAILHSTCVATMLRAGVQENALPARAEATIQCRIMPDETVGGTKATLEKVAADKAVTVSVPNDVVSGPESPPTPALLHAVETVVHSMWPGKPVIPAMAAGASDSIFTRNAGIPSYGVSGAWEDINDVRAHGRDERRAMDSFYQSIEFTYRLMKELGGG
ncbi:MAG: M20/M25/M40 family metallo-hydrolase [Alphaproteobacteria bacterium]|nr:M20/M25/M40 family metallo-hydrolase [Alphaproteobacteria bacterium]MBV9693927.1 M20/M25/M40 family metallo-hydrolase [Alphaproteobacteria bacterium]